jgi:hypothetical protein
MHPAAVLDALVDGTVMLKSRATTFNLVAAPDSTVVILAPATTTAVESI